MPITIANQEFEVVALDVENHASYRAYLLLLARRADRPILRFIREQCDGMTREERQDALRILPELPGWDEPPESLVLQWAKHPKAVAALARRVLRPEKSNEEWEKIIGAEANAVYSSLTAALEAIRNPSDDQIRRGNQAIRELLERTGAAKQDGGEGCKPEADGATS